MEKPVKGYEHLVTMEGRCGGEVTIRDHRLQPKYLVIMLQNKTMTNKDFAEIGIDLEMIDECFRYVKRNPHEK